MKLYSYWRSSSSWRVRIVLDYKKVPYEIIPINLIADDPEQRRSEHLVRNAMGQVPVLEIGGKYLQQSIAIMEYIEDLHPTPPLLPKEPWDKARVRAMVETINAGIQPLQNLAVTKYLAGKTDEKAFVAHFIGHGLHALEKMVRETAGVFCFGDAPTFADACLVPQLMGARRFGVSFDNCPTLSRVEKACLVLPAFQTSAPDRHPGAVTN